MCLKIFFQISMYFIELWLIFRKFRSYERSELQVHTVRRRDNVIACERHTLHVQF